MISAPPFWPFMFIFNHDMLLINIDSWPLGILIFVMTSIGAFAFGLRHPGVFCERNSWYDIPLLLCVSALMFRPDYFARFVNLDNYYLIYVAGLALWANNLPASETAQKSERLTLFLLWLGLFMKPSAANL